MGLFQDIHDGAKKRNLDFVVIGGIAVIFHGLTRDTADLELLIRRKIPILDHLLALKLHALKHGHIDRHMKDRLDVEGLIRVNHLDMKSEKMRGLFLKYGNLKLYEQVSRATESEGL